MWPLPEMYLRSVDAVLSGAVLAGRCLRSGRSSSPTPVSSCCCSCLSDQVDHQDPVVGKARYRLSNFVNGHFAVPESHNRVRSGCFSALFQKTQGSLQKNSSRYLAKKLKVMEATLDIKKKPNIVRPKSPEFSQKFMNFHSF